MDDFPFEVPQHDHMAARIPGKMPATVLTIERMVYTWRICEYSDPFSISRSWCYESFSEALSELTLFMTQPGNEPDGWVRANDYQDGLRVRRAHVLNGERVITVDEPD